MKAMSTAQVIPFSSSLQNARGSSPRTPRHSGSVASSGVATAASLRIARHRWPTVAANVSFGLCAVCVRCAPVRCDT